MTDQERPEQPTASIPAFEEVARRGDNDRPDMTEREEDHHDLQVSTLLFAAAFHGVDRVAGGRDVLLEPEDGEDQAEHIFRTGAVSMRDLFLGGSSVDTWAQLCRQDLEHFKPADAEYVAWDLLSTAQWWCKSVAYTPGAAELRDGAAGMLEDLCPRSWREAARRVLDRWTGPDEHHPAPVAETIDANPGVAAAAATAIVAWLYPRPEREKDPVKGLGVLAGRLSFDMRVVHQRDS